jgi:two-component system chemotaxis response regulator CheY
MRVLIVDDAGVFRAVARELLVRRGYVIAGEAACARDALALVDRTAPDAALVDVCLGEDDGFALAWQLAQTRPRLAVLMTSASFDQGFYHRAAESGARGYVPKQELAAADLSAFWRPSLTEEPRILGASDGLGPRRGAELAVDAVRLGLDRVG